MRGIEYINGKAFEYALAYALNQHIEPELGLKKNTAYATAKQAYNKGISTKHRPEFDKAAEVAVQHITKLEPNFFDKSHMEIRIQDDSAGQSGDVRDVIVQRHGSIWEIGLSAKNNHVAVKHSRLSDKIDFGKKWVNVPCSNQYMNAVSRMFGDVRKLRKEGVVYWRDVDSQKQILYKQLLNEFKDELWRLVEKDPTVPSKIMFYLLGRYDFYKIVKRRKIVQIWGYNRNETLNKSHDNQSTTKKVPRTKMPTRIIDATMKRNNDLQVVFDGGWSVSFRIHNAESKITPSLKLDIQLIGEPSNMYKHIQDWSL